MLDNLGSKIVINFKSILSHQLQEELFPIFFLSIRISIIVNDILSSADYSHYAFTLPGKLARHREFSLYSHLVPA